MNRKTVTRIGGGRNHGSIMALGYCHGYELYLQLPLMHVFIRFPFHLLPQLLCALSLRCHFCFRVLKGRPFMLEYLEGRVPMALIYCEMHQIKQDRLGVGELDGCVI